MAVGVSFRYEPVGSYPPQFIYQRRQIIDVFSCSCESCLVNFNLNVIHSDLLPVVTTTGQKLYPYFICHKLIPKWFKFYYTSQMQQALDIILNFSITEQQIFTFQRFVSAYHRRLADFDDFNVMHLDSGYTVSMNYDLLASDYVVLHATGLEGAYLDSLDISPEVGYEVENSSNIEHSERLSSIDIPIGVLSISGLSGHQCGLECESNDCVLLLLRQRFLYRRPRLKTFVISPSVSETSDPEPETLITSLSTWYSDSANEPRM